MSTRRLTTTLNTTKQNNNWRLAYQIEHWRLLLIFPMVSNTKAILGSMHTERLNRKI